MAERMDAKLFPVKPFFDEICANGGRSRSERKLAAVRKNLERAKEALNIKRQAKAAGQSVSAIDDPPARAEHHAGAGFS